ncbi:MAG: transcriptional regulator [Ruminococcus flavefaciens]|nr:transcriptional regulator [Ruminococcus flavefaciens]
MEISSMPEAFHNKLRLSIISALITGEKNFTELKKYTAATSGNLGAQLLKLEEWGYVSCRKEFVNKKPQSSYKLTEEGVRDFRGYVEMLERVLRGVEGEME